jgi:ribonuclease HII
LSKEKKNDSSELVCGIDEAGRGPVFGPLVLCGVCFYKPDLEILKTIGVKDSKKLTTKKRKELAKIIKDKCIKYKVLIVSAQEIDQRENKRITMNRLEELKMAEIINELEPNCIIIDAADVNEDRFGKSIEKLLNFAPKRIISEHKADDTYPIVSAASIIAKDKRDAIIDELKQKYGEIGSGYPSDPITIDFLRDYIKEYKKAPPIARMSWETTKRILNEEVKTRKITDYFK